MEFNPDDYVYKYRERMSPIFKELPRDISVNCQDQVIVFRKYPTGIRLGSRPCPSPGKTTCMMCHCGPEPTLPGVPEEELDEENEFLSKAGWRNDL